MARDINKDPFSEETKLKLEIFRKCFREWLPVFIHFPNLEKLYIYDFFAGSGYDCDGSPGSPIILLEEVMGEGAVHCTKIKEKRKQVYLVFNEKLQKKYNALCRNVQKWEANCEKINGCDRCVSQKYVVNFDFECAFKNNEKIHKVLANSECAKFVILDQYGFTQVDEAVFKRLVESSYTDFIFFISSSFIRRFSEHPVTKKFLGSHEISFEETKPEECHQVIGQYFESLIPEGREYYLNHFTIKKGTNYYGLIFGTAHTLGMEKFQKVCWELDKRAGESNCNIRNDFDEDSLFRESVTNKVNEVSEKLQNLILQGKISNNIEGLKLALKMRCRPIVFTNVVKKLEREGRIKREGAESYISTNIHKIKPGSEGFYSINILQ